jgi:Spy/CpxP family protein refolding chaperone
MLPRILVIAVLSAAMAAAQHGGGGGLPTGAAATDGGGWGSAHADRLSPRDQFAAKLKLDKDQRVSVEAILNTAQEAMGPAQQKLVEARRDMVLAMLDPKSGPEDVTKLTQAYDALSVQAKALEATAFGKICALLKPNQQSKAVPNFGFMAQLVEQGSMGAASGGGQSGHWGGDHGGQK